MSDSRKHIVADLDTLRALRERVREATEPDRELDAEISACLRFPSQRADRQWVNDWTGDWQFRGTQVHLMTVTGETAVWFEAPPLTSSIDTAVALVERLAPDRWWRIRCDGGWPGSGRSLHGAALVGPEGDAGFSYAATPALALIKALLTDLIARAEME